MKVAVLSLSGNVGKTTIARHLLAPRLHGAKVVSIESINADAGDQHVIRGRQYAELQEYLQLFDDVVVDIGASNIEDVLAQMQRYSGSHEDFDAFVVPSAPPGKQQRDTIATLLQLSRLGVPTSKVRVVFNMIEDGLNLEQAFEPVLAFARLTPIGRVSLECRLALNEVYDRVKDTDADLANLAADTTDYKTLIAASNDRTERLALAQRLAIRRLATGVLPELDACFAALDLSRVSA